MADKHEHNYARKYDPKVYGRDYFEAGTISGYADYSTTEQIVRMLYKAIIRTVREKHGPIGSAVDVACAYGFSVSEFLDNDIDATGFDVSEYAILKAKDRLSRITPADARRVSIGDALDGDTWKYQTPAKVDLVTACEFLEHIMNEDVDRVLHFMAQHARYGFFIANGSTSPDQAHDTDGDHGHLNHNSMLWWLKKIGKFGQIDFEAMYAFSAWAQKDGPKDVGWHSRAVAVKFDSQV